ncbi:hypothetical protein [Prochlorothrix hollandica]|uniref:hypothetical protein n=1 Tax=Prochlorothrix hollandica TaxID=1223 RepID=UPI003340BC17
MNRVSARRSPVRAGSKGYISLGNNRHRVGFSPPCRPSWWPTHRPIPDRLEVLQRLKRQISIFSGEEFTVVAQN